MTTVAIFLSFCVRVFILRSCDLRLTLGRAPLCSLTFSSVYRWMLLVRRKPPLVRWPLLFDGNREKSSGQAHLFNILRIGAMDRTSGQAEFVAQSYFEIPVSLGTCHVANTGKDDHTFYALEFAPPPPPPPPCCQLNTEILITSFPLLVILLFL